MGDRTYATVTVIPADVEEWKENTCFSVSGFNDLEDDDGFAVLEDEEANYGGDYETQKHCLFFGNHGDGYDYDAERFACDGKTIQGWRTDGCDLIILMDDKGVIPKAQTSGARAYLAFEKKVKKMMKERLDRPGLCVTCGTQCEARPDLSVICPQCEAEEQKTGVFRAL